MTNVKKNERKNDWQYVYEWWLDIKYKKLYVA